MVSAVIVLHISCRPAAEAALRLHTVVQVVRRQRAAHAALALPARLRCACRAQLASGPEPGANAGAEAGAEAEGKIKGPARWCPPSQSARGLGAAQRRQRCVLLWSHIPMLIQLARVLFSIHCAVLRWRWPDGIV